MITINSENSDHSSAQSRRSQYSRKPTQQEQDLAKLKKVITSAEETLLYEHTYKNGEMDELRIERPDNRVSDAVSKRPSRLV